MCEGTVSSTLNVIRDKLTSDLFWFTFLLTDLIKRLEEENKVNVYLCQEKLPKVTSSLS